MTDIKVYDVRVLPGDAAFLLDDGETAILYDTGFGFTGDGIAENIKKHLGQRSLDYIFLTHSHYDHALGCPYIKQHYPEAVVVASHRTAQVFQRPGAVAVMKDLDAKHANACGIQEYLFLADAFRVDLEVGDGDVIQAGKMCFEVLALSGHTHCSVGFYLRENGLLLACESLGVFNGDGLIVPSVLVSCKEALASIDRICGMDIRQIVMPHFGLMNDLDTRFFLDNCRAATQDFINFVYISFQDGKTNEDIIADFINAFWQGSVREKYPINAARMNTNIMINLVRKELMGQETV